MTFLSPERLWLLLAVLGLLLLYLVAQRRRRRHAVRFAALPLLARVAPNPGWRRHLPAALFLAMATLLVTGFARPETEQQVPREQATVVVALDLSTSMRAQDVEPDRFTVARDAAADFVESLPERYRVGLVTFSSGASVAVPPTTDRLLLTETLADLSPGGGTAIGDAMRTAVGASQRGVGSVDDRRVPARIVLLSDGQNSRGLPVPQGIRTAVRADVPISTIAYGTDDGSLGALRVPVDREALEEIADRTGGRAYAAATADQLREVYADLASSIGYRTERVEVSTWFVGAGLAAALLAAVGSMWFAGRLP